ncbi:hypothetical protein LIER_29255 [Lithospermum erythrorhizon]|uniref:RNase H type-1 domain-containing protein n=1 Tax=Lithospermum erythrorhizon TaxID=34254 RepID=A0AAV3RMN5_LITER
METPTSYKVVQRLTGCLAVLSRFISKSGDRKLPFFRKILQASKEPFIWDEECERAFTELKEYLGSPKLLTRPEGVEELQLYLAVSEGAVSSILVREEEGSQRPIYYVSHVLHGAEQSYPLIYKFVFAVVIAARKRKAYFEAHPVKALADFIVECTASAPEKVHGPRKEKSEEIPQWKLYVDGASNEKGSEAGILIEGPEHEVIEYAIRFSFKATNNEAKYEAMITGLQIAQALKIRRLLVWGDSKLVSEHIRGDCGVKSEAFLKYHAKALVLAKGFEYLSFKHIPRSQNEHADHLSRLATTYFGDLPPGVYVEFQEHPIHTDCSILLMLEEAGDWQSSISYLVYGELPSDKLEARSVINSSYKF